MLPARTSIHAVPHQNSKEYGLLVSVHLLQASIRCTKLYISTQPCQDSPWYEARVEKKGPKEKRKKLSNAILIGAELRSLRSDRGRNCTVSWVKCFWMQTIDALSRGDELTAQTVIAMSALASFLTFRVSARRGLCLPLPILWRVIRGKIRGRTPASPVEGP